jgi:hypothetical protein
VLYEQFPTVLVPDERMQRSCDLPLDRQEQPAYQSWIHAAAASDKAVASSTKHVWGFQ